MKEYRIVTTIQFDDWTVEALRHAYHRLGLGEPPKANDEFMSAVAHDLLHDVADEMEEAFLDQLSYRLPFPPPPPLSAVQLALADQLESLWIQADEATRKELLVRLGAWQTHRTRHWSLSLNSPLNREVVF